MTLLRALRPPHPAAFVQAQLIYPAREGTMAKYLNVGIVQVASSSTHLRPHPGYAA